MTVTHNKLNAWFTLMSQALLLFFYATATSGLANSQYSLVSRHNRVDGSSMNSFSHHRPHRQSSRTSSNVVMNLSGGFFDDLGKFFGSENDDNTSASKDTNVQNDLHVESSLVPPEIEEEYPGSSLIFRIKAKSIKLGGLRLWLFLNMMGQLNTPEPKSWKANQTDEKILEMFYKDTTGAIIVHFSEEDGISVFRFGSSPSINYMMNESTILLGILDELDKIVHQGDIKVEDRLLILEEPGDAIDKARELLSFG